MSTNQEEIMSGDNPVAYDIEDDEGFLSSRNPDLYGSGDQNSRDSQPHYQLPLPLAGGAELNNMAGMGTGNSMIQQHETRRVAYSTEYNQEEARPQQETEPFFIDPAATMRNIRNQHAASSTSAPPTLNRRPVRIEVLNSWLHFSYDPTFQNILDNSDLQDSSGLGGGRLYGQGPSYGHSYNSGTLGTVSHRVQGATALYHDGVENGNMSLEGTNPFGRASQGSLVSSHNRNVDMRNVRSNTTTNSHLEGASNSNHTGPDVNIFGEWASGYNAPSTGTSNVNHTGTEVSIFGEWGSGYNAPSTGTSNFNHTDTEVNIFGEWGSGYNASSTGHLEGSNNSNYANTGPHMPPSYNQAQPEQFTIHGVTFCTQAHTNVNLQQVTPASMNTIPQRANARSGTRPQPGSHTSV